MNLLKLLLAVRLVVAATITVSDQQTGWEGSKAIDSTAGTFWHSVYSPSNVPLPHVATIDLGSAQLLNGFNYLPRQDGNMNGRIGQVRSSIPFFSLLPFHHKFHLSSKTIRVRLPSFILLQCEVSDIMIMAV